MIDCLNMKQTIELISFELIANFGIKKIGLYGVHRKPVIGLCKVLSGLVWLLNALIRPLGSCVGKVI